MLASRSSQTHPLMLSVLVWLAFLASGVADLKLIWLATGAITVSGPIVSACFSPDGSVLVTGHIRGEVCTWDRGSWQQLSRWQLHKSFVYALAVASSGRWIASA